MDSRVNDFDMRRRKARLVSKQYWAAVCTPSSKVVEEDSGDSAFLALARLQKKIGGMRALENLSPGSYVIVKKMGGA